MEKQVKRHRGGQPKPEGEKRVLMNFRLAPDVVAALREQENISRTIDQAVRKYLNLPLSQK
jgi:hypothetical protein